MNKKTEIHYLEEEFNQLVDREGKVFNFLQNRSLDGVWYWDLKAPENEWMSAHFWRTFGYEPNEKRHLASEWQDIIFPEDLVLAQENFERHCADSDYLYDQVVRYRHKDGSTVWIRCHGLIIRDEHGEPHRMLGAHQDISQFKREEIERRSMQERFELAVDGASVGIWDWFDVNSSEEYWSPRFYQLLGYENGEIKANLENFKALLHPDDQAHTFSALEAHFQHSAPFYVEYRLKTKSGSYKWFRGTGVASRDKEGKPKRMVGSILDINDEKIYQDELEHTVAKLKQSNDDLERFAYVASHDLQEPLRVISSYVQLLSRRYQDKFDDNAKDFFGYIVDGCKRMQRLINDLLDFSRLNRDAIQMEEVDLNKVMQDIEQSLARQIDESGAIVQYESLPTVHGSPSQLTRLLQNLITNSLKYRQKDMILNVTVSAEEKDEVWHISIADNGIGIENKYFDRIFDIFQRLHRSCEYSGTGVGLAICKRIVDSHLGKIWVSSEPGKGSTFSFSLPKKPSN